jgi:predicted small lipoprotein YifL
MNDAIRRASLALIMIMVAGCGQKGVLFLPPEPPASEQAFVAVPMPVPMSLPAPRFAVQEAFQDDYSLPDAGTNTAIQDPDGDV